MKLNTFQWQIYDKRFRTGEFINKMLIQQKVNILSSSMFMLFSLYKKLPYFLPLAYEAAWGSK